MRRSSRIFCIISVVFIFTLPVRLAFPYVLGLTIGFCLFRSDLPGSCFRISGFLNKAGSTFEILEHVFVDVAFALGEEFG
jgi:hypothetical protein